MEKSTFQSSFQVGEKSNCFFGAIAIKHQLGGKIEWRPGWRRDGWSGFLGNPWGHFRVRLDNLLLSYSALDENLSVWRQLWFRGYVKRREVL